jgi:hypothetical protein
MWDETHGDVLAEKVNRGRGVMVESIEMLLNATRTVFIAVVASEGSAKGRLRTVSGINNHPGGETGTGVHVNIAAASVTR